MTLLAASMLTAASGCDDAPVVSAGADVVEYFVTFGVGNDAGSLNRLAFEIEYLGVEGGFVWVDGFADCIPLASVSSVLLINRGERALGVSLVDPEGFPTPIAAVRCAFATPDSLDATSFRVTLIDAAQIDGTAPPVSPDVQVIALRRADTDVDDPSADAPRYAVTMSVVSDSGILGSLQFDVTYLGESGGFVGAGASVDCTPEVDVALTSFNDRGHGRLSAAFVDLEGFATPTPVATCRFRTEDNNIGVEDFEVTVVDASGPDLGASSELPEMAVTSVVASP